MKGVIFISCLVFLIFTNHRVSADEMSIEEVLSKNTEKLMSIPGVIGVGQGSCNSDPCIKILVVEKTPEIIQKIPAYLDGYVVEIQITGRIKANPESQD